MKIYSKAIKETKYSYIESFLPFHQDKALYLDIETTGFMRQRDMVYLLGLLYQQDDKLIITQFLCEKKEDEYELLFRFNQMIENFKILVHFNGDSFDLPFLIERMKLYNIHEKLSSLLSFDFYKKVKPYKKLLATDNLKLKTLEKLCGFHRMDPFTGGELIQLFKKYLDGDLNLASTFTLHNEEDMIGLYHMNALLPILLLTDKAGDLYYVNQNEIAVYSQPLKKEKVANITDNRRANRVDYDKTKTYSNIVTLVHGLKKKSSNLYTFSLAIDNYLIELRDQEWQLSAKVQQCERKLFFKDYKDYYYLPEEDTAIHKSVASYMSSKYRRQATVKTAYIRRLDLYVKCPFTSEKMNKLLDEGALYDIHLFNDTIKDNYCYLLLDDYLKIIPSLYPFFIRSLLI